ncbi:MAG: hypothetical protein LBL46_00630 [Rickettsiales bacterium]|jgi:ClpP class serine protease|nr:hypothetical protein [Rickettsiales bacterium]
MPNWNAVGKEISDIAQSGHPAPFDYVREKYLEQLFRATDRNVISYYDAWLQKKGYQGGIDDEDINAFMSVIHGLDRRKGLYLILHTPGGSIVAVESLIKYLMKMFDNDVVAIIPQISMSAGTMMACACKEIIMGKQSSLGPIDPQINGGFPCQGIVDEFNSACEAIEKRPATTPIWVEMVSKYQPSLIGECQKAIQLSENLCKYLLKNNMFASAADKDEISDSIVNWLSSHNEAKTHGRHFDIDTCKRNGLKIRDLESDNKFQDIILTLHHAYIHTLANTFVGKIVENHNKQRFIFMVNQPM